MDIDEYINKLDICYKSNNIISERCELYCDFLISLTKTIDETFLGFDTIDSVEDIYNHFTWCFDKITKDLEYERIYFNEKGNHYKYLWFFFFESFYVSKMNNKNPPINEYIYRLFDFRHIKSTFEISILTEIYKILEQNLKK